MTGYLITAIIIAILGVILSIALMGGLVFGAIKAIDILSNSNKKDKS